MNIKNTKKVFFIKEEFTQGEQIILSAKGLSDYKNCSYFSHPDAFARVQKTRYKDF
jgi:hypothetical protein